MSLNDRLDELVRLEEEFLVEQAVHCDSEATKLILIRCIAHLHQAKDPNIMFEYSMAWAKGCVWLANERM